MKKIVCQRLKLELHGIISTICSSGGTYSRYWKIYGGWRALLSSPYLYFAAIVTLICYPIWLSEEKLLRTWPQFCIDVIPSIMGFSLGGMAILLAFSHKEFLTAIREEGDESSLFMNAVVLFFHFLLIQVIAILLAVISKSYSSDILSAVGFYFTIYGILSALGIAAALFQIARIFNASDDD